MIALLCLATGQAYWQFIAPFLYSASKFFPHHSPILFTDSKKQYTEYQFHAPPLGYPDSTLKRYHTFLTQRERLKPYSHIFYSDIDDLFVTPITEEDICSPGITATAHSCFYNRDPLLRTYEPNPKSTAFMKSGDCYYAGGFVGGEANSFLQMAETIAHNIDTDERNGILAMWHDESHLNKYLSQNPPSKILGPEYHYPEPLWLQPKVIEACGKLEPRIVCLEKKWKVA